MLDPWTRRKIIADLKSGLSYSQIAEKHAVKRTQISYIVGAEKLGRKKINDKDLQIIAELAKSKTSTVDISERLDLSLFQVRYSLRKLGLNRRKGRPCKVKQMKSCD